MKKTILFLIATLLSFGALGQRSLRWNYPCKPGIECWNALTSVAERQEACQIKGIDLSILSTEELLLITMEHPFFRSYVLSDNPIRAMQNAVGTFNGYRELLNRADAMTAIRNVYLKEDFDKLVGMRDTAEIGSYTLQWVGVELLMANDKLLRQLSDSEKVLFLKELVGKNLAREKHRDVFGGISNATVALIGYKVIKTLAINVSGELPHPDELTLFESNLLVHNPNTIRQLQSYIDNFLRNN
jgi:hypothetical protein